MPLKRAPRLRAFDYRGPHRYSVTICVDRRDRVFVGEVAIGPARELLASTSTEMDMAVIAYCFMPDHLHLLLEGLTAAADFRNFMRLFKQRSSYRWKQLHGRELWQRSYFDHVLREEEETIAVARYILANPVRAGFVSSPEDYPFLGSMTMALRDLLYSIVKY
jgi:putative transposase